MAGGLLSDFSFALADSSLRQMFIVCCAVGKGLKASNFLFVSVSRTPAMMRVVSRVSLHAAHKSAASARLQRRM
jgi:hypothetical protein